MSRLLLIDDDARLTDMVGAYLRHNGFEVDTALTLAAGREQLRHASPDALLLDLMLPDGDGLEFTRELRAEPRTRRLPLLMLTARGEPMDRIVGLEIGADDYLPKPFNPRELLARIRAVLRRVADMPANGRTLESGILRFLGWTLDLTARRLESPDRALVDLTTGEFDLLVAFVQHANRVLSRDQLLDLTHGRSAIPFDRSIDIQVSRLRRKIEINPKGPAIIKTVRGGGYMFTPAVERS